MKFVLFLVALCAAVALARPLNNKLLRQPAITQKTIDAINNDPTSTWVAGFNGKFRHMRLADVKRFLGAKLNGPKLPELEMDMDEIEALPTDYDVRTQWGTVCPTTLEVRDQSNCGSCWAFGAVEAMSDRICIASNGKAHTHVSAADLVACCSSCGEGCQGGYPEAAWTYWQKTGLVDGGNYSTAPVDNGCYPYPFQPCEHHVNGSHYPPCDSLPEPSTPRCPKKCDAHSSEKWTDKTFANSSYSVSGVSKIQAELMAHGSLEVAFTVYADFLAYKSGVYVHKTGSELGGHAVKLIGWGVEDGVKYWTIVNSWNSDWGDNGQFKIKRGTDECGIEDDVCGGMPKPFW